MFIRCDHIKAPLEKPYTGPFKVIERPSDRVFKVEINGQHKNINIERLKPAYITKLDDDDNKIVEIPKQKIVRFAPDHWGSSMDPPMRT